MSSGRCRSILALLSVAALLVLPATVDAAALSERYGKLPLHFEENRGQAHQDVRFLARGPGYGLHLTASEAVLALEGAVLRMALVGARPDSEASGLGELPGKANYFIGRDSSKWRTNIPTYAKVRYREVYPGIDLVYYGNQRQLEYDFVVAPGADPKRIVLHFDGAEKLEINPSGDLVLHVARGEVRVKKPVVYQDIGGERHEIDGRYVIRGEKRVGFELASYDATQAIVIDPVLAYSTYLGGRFTDYGVGIAVDRHGNAYVVGSTGSDDFPTTLGAFQPIYGGTGGPFSIGDAFVTKLNPGGTALLYSTYVGGALRDDGSAIAVDAEGNAYVTGSTESYDFPTTAGAFQQTRMPLGDAYVAKLGPTGSTLSYSTFLGGGNLDSASGIAVDTDGNAYVTGNTDSVDFPTTPQAFQRSHAGEAFSGDAFVTKFNAAGSALVYSTYLGGSGYDDWGLAIAVDGAGSAYVTGIAPSNDFPTTAGAYQPASTSGGGFLTKLEPTGSALAYSTYLRGRGSSVAVDSDGNAYVGGATNAADFPTTPGAFQTAPGGGMDAYVTKFNADGSGLLYSTRLGGSGADEGMGIAVDASGGAYVTGGTTSANFPTTAGAFQSGFAGGTSSGGDAFMVGLDPAGSVLIYSTYLGGSSPDSGFAIAVDSAGNPYLAGVTRSGDFPVSADAFQPEPGDANQLGDGFVAAFRMTTVRYEEDAAAYQGYWPSYGPEIGSFSGDAIRASNQATAAATFTFTGTAITWIGVKCNVCGTATVQIDGGAPTIVNTHGPGVPGSLTSEPVFTASGLAPGVQHTLTILVTGGGTAVPDFVTGSAHVAVDAFDVTE